MLHIVESDISPLGDRFASRDTDRDILETRVARELGEPQRLVKGGLGGVGEAKGGRLGAVGVEADDGEGAALGEAGSGARVGAEAEVKAGKVEGRDGRASHELDVRVQSEGAQLEEVDWTGGAGLLRGRMGYDRSCSLDRMLRYMGQTAKRKG